MLPRNFTKREREWRVFYVFGAKNSRGERVFQPAILSCEEEVFQADSDGFLAELD